MLSDVVIQKGFTEPAAQSEVDKDITTGILIEQILQTTQGAGLFASLRCADILMLAGCGGIWAGCRADGCPHTWERTSRYLFLLLAQPLGWSSPRSEDLGQLLLGAWAVCGFTTPPVPQRP